MSYPTTLSLLGLILLLIACSKEGMNDCSSTGKIKISDLSIYDAKDFEKFDPFVTLDSIVYVTSYHSDLQKSYYNIETQIVNYCQGVPLSFHARAEFKNAFTELKDSLRIFEINSKGNSVANIIQSISPNSNIYTLDAPYFFNENGNLTYINNVIYFPYQGSAKQDSIYFFSNLINMDLSTNFRSK